MADVNRDFIPEGDDPGALGSGFKDFVPTPEVVETPAPKAKKGNKTEEATEEVVEEIPAEEVVEGNPDEADFEPTSDEELEEEEPSEEESGSGKKKAN